MKHFVFAITLSLFLLGCNPLPNPEFDSFHDDTTQISMEWKVFGRDENGNVCFYSKEDKDSTTMLEIDGCAIYVDKPYAIISDFKFEKKRIITIGFAMTTTADSSMWFDANLIPDKINYDKYSPNN
jgi:hypothetical protein